MEDKDKSLFNLTEEEAKIAAENVKILMDYLKKNQSKEARMLEKLKDLQKQMDELPEEHYKRVQLTQKIEELKRKMKKGV